MVTLFVFIVKDGGVVLHLGEGLNGLASSPRSALNGRDCSGAVGGRTG